MTTETADVTADTAARRQRATERAERIRAGIEQAADLCAEARAEGEPASGGAFGPAGLAIFGRLFDMSRPAAEADADNAALQMLILDDAITALRERAAGLDTTERAELLDALAPLALGDADPWAEPEGRLCACGCGRPVTSPRPEARYATAACRVRAHRAR